MSAYYNEIDPVAAEWLRRLIAAGHIAPGEVDERSIVDVRADDLRGFTQCHFFAGIGVWSYALRLAGWNDERAVWTGSCPCQPFSDAGRKAGLGDERHLWPHWWGLARIARPDALFGEQVASADGIAWLDFVCADLEAAGYAVGTTDLSAAGFGAPHVRQRMFFVGHAQRAGLEGHARHGDHGDESGRLGAPAPGPASAAGATGGFWGGADWVYCRDEKCRPIEPGTFPLAHGAPARVGRLRAYGNAICAPVAAEFIRAYLEVTA